MPTVSHAEAGTSITIPLRKRAASVSQLSTNIAKSGEFRLKSARQNAKFFSSLSEVLDSSLTEVASWSR